MSQTNDFMRTRSIFSLLLSMSIPMMFSMLIQALYNIVDSIYVSRLGTEALTAVSLAFPLQNTILAVSVGTGVGISSAISICLGAKQQERANRTATIGIGLSLFHCILFIIAGIVITEPFLRMFTDDPTVLGNSIRYSRIVLCLSCGYLMQVTFEKIFQGIGEMKVTMVILAAGCIINIILDPILIFGMLGLPAMGVTGAAIASIIGQVAGAVLYIIVYLHRPFAVQVHPCYMKFDTAIIRQIYSVGIPSSIMMVLPSVLISISNHILSGFSGVYVAVLGVYYKLQTFIYMPVNGIVQGIRPIIGFNFGAGETKRVKTTIRYSLLLTMGIMALGTLLAQVFPAQLLALFDAKGELLTYGICALRIIGLGFLISAVSLIYSGTFEALGRGKHSLIISLLRQILITVPASFLLSSVIGAEGVFYAFPLGEIVAAVCALFLLKKYANGTYSPF